MNSNWKDFFYFTKTERNGLLLLLSLCVFLLALPFFFPLLPAKAPTDFSRFEQEIAKLLASNKKVKAIASSPIPPPNSSLFYFDPNLASKEDFQQLGLPKKVIEHLINYRNKGGRFYKKQDLKKIYGLSDKDYQRLHSYINIQKQDTQKQTYNNKSTNTPSQKPKPILTAFDPNKATKEDLIQLGIPEKAVQILLNFRNKGGTFRKKEDLQKIFGISPTLYQILEEYIEIPEPLTAQMIAANSDKQSAQEAEQGTEQATIILDINQASKEEWQKLKGIGPYYAQRIVEAREKLGGFYNVEQIGETYGLPDSTFRMISPQLKASPILRQIPLNRATFEQLKNHPYLNYRQAQALFNYRNNHGSFKNWEDLAKVRALSPESLKKIKPYLSLEQ